MPAVRSGQGQLRNTQGSNGYRIYDLLGRPVLSGTFAGTDRLETIDISGLNTGLYLFMNQGKSQKLMVAQ